MRASSTLPRAASTSPRTSLNRPANWPGSSTFSVSARRRTSRDTRARARDAGARPSQAPDPWCGPPRTVSSSVACSGALTTSSPRPAIRPATCTRCPENPRASSAAWCWPRRGPSRLDDPIERSGLFVAVISVGRVLVPTEQGERAERDAADQEPTVLAPPEPELLDAFVVRQILVHRPLRARLGRLF